MSKPEAQFMVRLRRVNLPIALESLADLCDKKTYQKKISETRDGKGGEPKDG